MNYIDKSQWGFIESGDTASQDSALVTAGMVAALGKMKDRHAELNCGYGIFLLDEINLDGTVDGMISGAKSATFQMSPTAVKILDVIDCLRLRIDGIKFKGTATADVTYRAHDLLDIRNDSAFVNVTNCDFTDYSRWGIVGRLLAGGVATEGIIVDRCLFYDAPNFHADTALQAAVALGSDGEYSAVTNSRFYRVPCAARFTDGANGFFTDNIVMSLNGGSGSLQTDRAAVYVESNTNNGKITIARNKMNHNDSGLVPIIVKGDVSKPQNPVEILDNDLLVNGTASVGYQLMAYDFPNIKIRGNKFRPATSNVHPNVHLEDCDAAIVAENYFRAGTYAIGNKSSAKVQWSTNICESLGTGKILNSSGGTTINRNNKAFAFRVSSGGAAAAAPWDDSSWTVSRPVTGQFTVVHNMNSVDYVVAITQDNATTPTGPRVSVVRAANQFDVYVTDNAGTAANINFTATVTVGNGNEYAI